MYEQLKARVAELLVLTPRALPAQTQRQLDLRVGEFHTSVESFLSGAGGLLEEFELDILFAPVFTPTIEERSRVGDLLFHWKPNAAELSRMVGELTGEIGAAPVVLADGRVAKLALHEVMVERFVRLLRLDAAAEASVAAALREALPADLWNLGMALLCERGMAPAHQDWLARFANHARSHHPLSRQWLMTSVDFIASQTDLTPASLLAAAEALKRASESTAAFAASGHNYWSADVAQHHHYRGQGTIDRNKVAERQAEAESVAVMVEDLKTFEN